MNVLGEWAPLVQALGVLVGAAFFAQRARRLWKERQRKKMLARRPPVRERRDQRGPSR